MLAAFKIATHRVGSKRPCDGATLGRHQDRAPTGSRLRRTSSSLPGEGLTGRRNGLVRVRWFLALSTDAALPVAPFTAQTRDGLRTDVVRTGGLALSGLSRGSGRRA